MENRVDRAGLPPRDEQLTLSADEFFPSSALFQRQATSPIKRNGRSLARRKEELALFIVLALLVIAVCVSTGFLVLRSLAKPGPSKKWSFQPEGYVGITFSPIVANGMVYVLFEGRGIFDDSRLYALDARSGRVEWSYRLHGFIPFSPVQANHMVYVVSDDGVDGGSTLYALDAVSGHEKWAYQTDSDSWSSPLVVNGIIYLDSKDGNLYALDALSGHKLWTRQLGGDFFTSPTVANSMVYVVSDDLVAKESTLYALDAVTGHKKWAYQETNSTLVSSQPTVANGTVYLASSDGTLDALDAVMGHKKWSYRQWSYQMGSFNFSILMVVNGVVYVDGGFFDGSNYNGYLYALNAQSGDKIWASQNQVIPATPVVANGVAYLLSTNGSLYALDAVTGHKEWSFQVGKLNPDAPEPIEVNGIVYVRSPGGTLHALDAASGREEWSFQVEGFVWLSPTMANGIIYMDDLDKLDAIHPPGMAS
jgi:eukaryotic-like serine/threonine-protein kinase